MEPRSPHTPIAPGGVFALAPMSPLIAWLTGVVLALPIVFSAAGLLWARSLLIPGLLIAGLDVWVWLRFRPTCFVVGPDAIDVIWPLKRRRIGRGEIVGVRLVDAAVLRGELGWCTRVGVGGLWGAFGWLWTQRRGIVQMYVSRVDGLVWIERVHGRPWLITPEHPDRFLRALSG